jgi:hypothetical protein
MVEPDPIGVVSNALDIYHFRVIWSTSSYIVFITLNFLSIAVILCFDCASIQQCDVNFQSEYIKSLEVGIALRLTSG